MFHHEYDSVTGLPLYSFWALPGTLDTAAAWRGLKWTWSGDALLAALWADGNDTLDNVYANRAALTYAANPALAIARAHVAELRFTIAVPAATQTLPYALTGQERVTLNGLLLEPVAGPPPDGNEWAFSGSVLTVGVTMGVGEKLLVEVPM